MSEPAVVTPPAFAVARPQPGEYAPYYERYISLVNTADILGTLEAERRKTLLLLSGRDEADGDFRYAPDKWSAKEVLGHVCDTERVFAYRALRIARADRTPMEGFEQDDYVREGPHAQVPLADLIEELKTVRAATLAFFRNLRPTDWTRRGTANTKDITVRALAFVIAGHEVHHRQILEERYFRTTPARAEIA